MTKATPLLPCQRVGRLVHRYLAPTWLEGTDLGWNSSGSPPSLQPHFPFQQRSASWGDDNWEGLETESRKCLPWAG